VNCDGEASFYFICNFTKIFY